MNQSCTSTYPMLIFPTIGIPYLSGMLKLPEIAVATITWKDREGRAVSRKSWAGSEHEPCCTPRAERINPAASLGWGR